MIDWDKINFVSSFGHRIEASPESICFAPLIKKVLSEKTGCLTKYFNEGYSDTAFDLIMKKIEELNGRKVYENIYQATHGHSFLFAWDDAMVEITSSKSKLTTINAISANEKITEVCKEVAKLFSAPTKKGYVFAITKGQTSLNLTRIGHAGMVLEKGNYSSKNIEDYDYVINDLKSKQPSGRVIILEGVPGCGKSTLIRGILMDIQEGMFVIIPPNMVSSMGGPELLPLLLKNRETFGRKGPTILILEDADQCLAPRQHTDISSISTILNLGDGIFGSLFDIRIIATTNAKSTDIDKAITRDGRLSKRMSLGPMSYKPANAIFQRILNDEKKMLPAPDNSNDTVGFGRALNSNKEYTLAEIYRAARNAGWTPPPAIEHIPTGKDRYMADYFDEEDYL
jgi:SpoVK/Ycf46/Vps4 family AAA+-type ATPase